MPIRQPDPFVDPTQKLKTSVNPFVDEMTNSNLPIFYGDSLKDKAQNWRNEEDNQNLCVEIGCYKGKTLVEMAKSRPQDHFIGIDITFKRVVTTAKRAERHELKNVSTLLANMNSTSIEKIFAPKEIDLLMVFFPDPWTKKKQLKNRLLNTDFCRAARKVLREKGHFWIKTDNLDYFEQAETALSEAGFVKTQTTEYTDISFETPFEKTFISQGLNTYESIWAKDTQIVTSK